MTGSGVGDRVGRDRERSSESGFKHGIPKAQWRCVSACCSQGYWHRQKYILLSMQGGHSKPLSQVEMVNTSIFENPYP